MKTTPMMPAPPHAASIRVYGSLSAIAAMILAGSYISTHNIRKWNDLADHRAGEKDWDSIGNRKIRKAAVQAKHADPSQNAAEQ